MRFLGRIAVDARYNGLALDGAEGERIARAMQGKRRGLPGQPRRDRVGARIAHAYDDLYYLERACLHQVIALSTGRPLAPVNARDGDPRRRRRSRANASSRSCSSKRCGACCQRLQSGGVDGRQGSPGRRLPRCRLDTRPSMSTHLTAGQRALMESALLQRQTELERQVEQQLEGRSRTEHALEVLQQDGDDAPARDADREVDLARSDRGLVELRSVNAALERLRTSRYGLCSDCDAEIPFDRLHGNPQALRCVACQTAFESAARHAAASGHPLTTAPARRLLANHPSKARGLLMPTQHAVLLIDHQRQVLQFDAEHVQASKVKTAHAPHAAARQHRAHRARILRAGVRRAGRDPRDAGRRAAHRRSTDFRHYVRQAPARDGTPHRGATKWSTSRARTNWWRWRGSAFVEATTAWPARRPRVDRRASGTARPRRRRRWLRLPLLLSRLSGLHLQPPGVQQRLGVAAGLRQRP